MKGKLSQHVALVKNGAQIGYLPDTWPLSSRSMEDPSLSTFQDVPWLIENLNGCLQRSGVDVVVLEARDRVGGRIQTEQSSGLSTAVDLGASIITGTEIDVEKGLQPDPSTIIARFKIHLMHQIYTNCDRVMLSNISSLHEVQSTTQKMQYLTGIMGLWTTFSEWVHELLQAFSIVAE